MMKYLARTSSEGEINKVIHQHARCEGSVGERRRRAGQLRNEQEQLEQQMSQTMQSLATSLQADAHARAVAKQKAAAEMRQMNVAAEQAARVMGAVAPHRAAARDAALAVVAPKDSWAPSSSAHAPDLSGRPHSPNAQADVSAHHSVLLAEHSACLTIRPGKCVSRATLTPAPPRRHAPHCCRTAHRDAPSCAAPHDNTPPGAPRRTAVSVLTGPGSPPEPGLRCLICWW